MGGRWAASVCEPASAGLARKALGCAGAVSFCLLAVCGGGGGSGGFSDEGVVGDAVLEPAFDDIAFAGLVRLVQHPTLDDRWYAVQQDGEVHTFLATDPLNTDSSAVDVNDFVGNLGAGNEQGLLGMAFDPDFDEVSGGEIYLAYTDEGNDASVLARYESMDGGMTFAPAAQSTVLEIPHPNSNHNGGDIHFGVFDDFLYYSMGDGGGTNDPDDNGQDPTTLLGTVMRLDVRSAPPAGRDYAIPSVIPPNPFAANPFCDTGVSPTMVGCPEIFAWGLRNPYRMGFDSMTGDLWLGDVGQAAREEVDLVVAGGNYGWDCREGDIAGPSAPCPGMFEEPEAVYDHAGAGALSVIGGVVYRGSDIPTLVGYYLYADFYTGEIWALDTQSMADPVLLIDSPYNVSSFTEARDGEVYVTVYGDPSVYRLAPAPAP